MLAIHDRAFNRRSFLKIGSLALGGLSLPQLFAADAKRLLTDKSVIFLFLHGGPSQIETFDPKMTAPAEHSQRHRRGRHEHFPASLSAARSRSWRRSPTGCRLSAPSSPATATTTSSRSSASDTFGANLGSIYSRIAGANHPRHRHADQRRRCSRGPSIPRRRPGTHELRRVRRHRARSALACAPFDPSGGGRLQKDMHADVAARPARRSPRIAGAARSACSGRSCRRSHDRRPGSHPRTGVRHLLGGVADAFDLSKEDPQRSSPATTRRRWCAPRTSTGSGTTTTTTSTTPSRWASCCCWLAGCASAAAGFVTVTTNFVWDMHADVNNAPVAEGMRYMGAAARSRASSAFIEDVEARGLSDKILLVVLRRNGPHAARSTTTAAAITGATLGRCCLPAAG